VTGQAFYRTSIRDLSDTVASWERTSVRVYASTKHRSRTQAEATAILELAASMLTTIPADGAPVAGHRHNRGRLGGPRGGLRLRGGPDRCQLPPAARRPGIRAAVARGVTGTAQLGWTDDAGSSGNTAGDFYPHLPAGTTTSNGHLIDSHPGGDGGATWSYVYPTNHTGQPAEVGSFALIFLDGAGAETGSESFGGASGNGSPFSEVIAAGQAMTGYGWLGQVPRAPSAPR
jgi:hypothetical protein